MYYLHPIFNKFKSIIKHTDNLQIRQHQINQMYMK